MDQSEHFFICPCCLAEISMLLDPSVDEQVMIEDCEVCCRPLEISYKIETSEVSRFTAKRA
jgi:hypothetical protein